MHSLPFSPFIDPSNQLLKLIFRLNCWRILFSAYPPPPYRNRFKKLWRTGSITHFSKTQCRNFCCGLVIPFTCSILASIKRFALLKAVMLLFTKQFTAFFLSITLLLTSFPLQICYPYPILLNLKKLPKYWLYRDLKDLIKSLSFLLTKFCLSKYNSACLQNCIDIYSVAT